MIMEQVQRCEWGQSSPVYIEYHDKEWGVPSHDDQKHFEFLVLESAQAGLSWLTILKRREGYRRLYADFDAEKVARYNAARIQQMLLDTGIIRNRLKIESSINNAKRFLEIQESHGSFTNYIWGFNNGKQVVNRFTRMSEIPATSSLSVTISKDMRKRGFRFLGPTTLYAHMQATGLVNDHVVDCFRYRECIAP